MRKSGADAAKTAAACSRSDLRDKVGARSQWARLAACVRSGGRERCVQTHGAHWGGGTQSASSTAAKVLRSAGEREAAADRFWTEKKERKNAPDRKETSAFVSLSIVPGGSRFCLHAFGPLNTDVSGPPRSGCSAAPPAKLDCVTGGFTLHLDVLIFTRTSFVEIQSFSLLFLFYISDASIWDEPHLEVIVSPLPTARLAPSTPMMTMSSLSDTLVPPDTSKSAFLEFGGHGYPGHQQASPGLSHNHYPVHGLHAVGPPQHDGPFSSGASSYGRPLGYTSYHSPVSAHHPGPYLPYQHGGHGGALGHTRLEDVGKLEPHERFTVCVYFFFGPM